MDDDLPPPLEDMSEQLKVIQEAKKIDDAPDEDYSDAVDQFMNANFDELGLAMDVLIEDLLNRPFKLSEKQQERKEKSLKYAQKDGDDFTDFGELVYHMLTHKVKTNSKSKKQH